MKDIKRKKGFTLVELLAVIAIVAILVIIALPNIMGYFNTSKRKTFVLEAKSLYKAAIEKKLLDSNENYVYSTGFLDITGGKDLEYSISTNKNGQVICFQVANSKSMFKY